MEIVISIIKVIAIASAVLTLIPVMIWWERKGSAYIQDRRGPNRAHIFGIRLGGLIHNIADVFKLLFKEDIIPEKAHKVLYVISPMIVLVVAVSILGVIPFAAPLNIDDYLLNFQIADLNIGVLYILAISSLGVYGAMLAGWSSSNSYSLLGGLRASAQMISYEVAMGLALIGVLMYSGSVKLDEIIVFQGTAFWDWNFLRQPIAFILFLVALFAETNRNPFDLPEGESEIVGFHVEYSSMKFALFFMAEYAHIVVGSMILVCLFVGGWQVPFLSTEDLVEYMPFILKVLCPADAVVMIFAGYKLAKRAGKFGWGDMRDYEPLIFGLIMLFGGIGIIVFVMLGGVNLFPEWMFEIFARIVQMKIFLLKTLSVCWLFIWVRWTLPRFRYDQLMKLGWGVMVPLGLINVIITGFLLVR